MENKIRLQNDNYNNLNKSRKNFKKSPKERLTEIYIQVRLEALEQLWTTFVTTHRQLLETYGVELKVHDYVTKDVYDQAEELYLDYKTELKTILKSFVKSTPTEASETSVVMNEGGGQLAPLVSKFVLPKIVIPKFSGKYEEWVTFRDLFSSLVHKNENLDNVQKMHYLKGYLSGEAEQLLRQIPIAGDNYNKCWNLLVARYDNKQYLSNCILKRLFSQKNLAMESAQGLKDLIDTTSDCLNALVNLGVDVSDLGHNYDTYTYFEVGRRN